MAEDTSLIQSIINDLKVRVLYMDFGPPFVFNSRAICSAL